MKSLQDIKYDWVTSNFYKEKNMSKWAENFVKEYENELDFELLNRELKELIYQDTLIGLNSFNKYGAFEMLWSTVPSALLYELSKAYQKIKL
jgi:hypothetical protein